MNILIIMSDTLRRDHVGCYGNDKIYTPNLDRLAAESVVFDHHYIASFPTIPARADMLTGRYDFTYLGWNPLPAEEQSAPRLFKQAGYTTLGAADDPYVTRDGYAYERYFDQWVWIRGQWPPAERNPVVADWRPNCDEDRFAARTVMAAERLLEQNYKKPFYMWVDLWDPHEFWDAPAYYTERYWPDYDGKRYDAVYAKFKDRGLTAEDVRKGHATYCGEVSMVDHWVGRLLARLDTLGLTEKTAVFFTADHGYYFGEHEFYGKCNFGPGYRALRSPLYDEVTRIPLLARIPGIAPRRTEALSSTPDLMPTVLELTGQPIPDTVEAHSLAPILRGKADRVRDFAVSSHHLQRLGDRTLAVDAQSREVVEAQPASITDGRWTLLYTIAGEPLELYDTQADPKQQNNLAATHRKEAERLHAMYLSLLKRCKTEEGHVEARLTL